MVSEGVKFEPNVSAGVDIAADELSKRFDAVLLCMGAGQPRELRIPGIELAGVHFAMDFLPQQNRRVAGDPPGHGNQPAILAKDKQVVVIGGGDTGSDCVGTAIRQEALSVTQLEILPAARPRATMPKRRGPSGRKSCEPRRRRRKVASAAGAH